MSYCVNCGVELAESEKACPLCDTEVINPRSPWTEPLSRPYPNEIETILSQIDRRYIASLLTIFLMIPVFVSLVCNLIYGEGITWSAYVIGAGAMLFIWIVLPLYFTHYRLLLFLGFDCLAVMLYLLFIDLVVNEASWFLPLGLPISGTFSVLLLLSAFVFSRERGKLILVRAAILFMDISVLVLAIEISTDLYVRGEVSLSWAPFVIIPCLVLAVSTQIIERKKNLKEEMRKRIHY
jgi:hypothetical protein